MPMLVKMIDLAGLDQTWMARSASSRGLKRWSRFCQWFCLLLLAVMLIVFGTAILLRQVPLH